MSVRGAATSVLHEILVVLAALSVTVLGLGLIVLVLAGVPILGLVAYARLSTTTVEWPDPSVVTMREQADQQFPPPPRSSFDTATITTYYDGDHWKCVRYKTESSADDARAHYEAIFRQMQWSVRDGYGQDGPYIWQLSIIAMEGTVRLTPWDDGVPVESAPPPYRVAICFIYEAWRWPPRPATTPGPATSRASSASPSHPHRERQRAGPSLPPTVGALHWHPCAATVV